MSVVEYALHSAIILQMSVCRLLFVREDCFDYGFTGAWLNLLTSALQLESTSNYLLVSSSHVRRRLDYALAILQFLLHFDQSAG